MLQKVTREFPILFSVDVYNPPNVSQCVQGRVDVGGLTDG